MCPRLWSSRNELLSLNYHIEDIKENAVSRLHTEAKGQRLRLQLPPFRLASLEWGCRVGKRPRQEEQEWPRKPPPSLS